MTIKVYDGSTWQPQKSLRVYNNGVWNPAKKGWVSQNGINWSQFYPEYPLNTVSPSVSGTATQGNTLTCAPGTWNTTDAYAPTSYAYQWTRAGTDISGATSSTYTTVLADVANAIGCKVTATNNRGPQTVSSSNTITVTSALPGPPSNLTITSVTATPGTFTVSGSSSSTTPTISMGANSGVTSTAGTINWTSTGQNSWSSNGTFSGSGNPDTSTRSVSKTGLSPSTSYTGTVTVTGVGSTTASGSWTAATNTSSYSVSTSAATLSSDNTNRTWSLSSGTVGGSYTITVTATNTSGSASISWSAGTNATSYDIYINGVYNANTTNLSYTYNWGTTGTLSVTVRSRNSAGAETTGVSGSNTISSASRQSQSTGSFASAQSASANYSLTTSAAPNLTAPTISSVTPPSTPGGTLTVNFSGGSGPYYQIWWQGGTDYSTITGYDAESSSSPISDTTGPGSAGTWYVAIRSVSALGTTGSGPSSSISSWSSPTSFTVSSGGGGGVGTTSIVGTPSADSCSPASTYIEFTPATNATCYDFYWANSNSAPSAGTSPDYSCQSASVTGSNRYVLLSIGGALWWWVRGKDGSGNTGAWSTGKQASNSGVC